MKTEILKRYAELKIQEKAVKREIEQLNPIVKKEILANGLDKLPTNLGNFTIKKIKKWTYSPNLTGKISFYENKIEEEKKEEQADGTATFVEVDQLEFREAKND